VATDYGGTYGGHPWHETQPPYAGHVGYGGPPGWPPPGPRPQARSSRIGSRRIRFLAVVVLGLGFLGFLGSAAGIGDQVMPRKFTADQRQQITNWEFGTRWRTLQAGAIFPASVSYPAPVALSDDAGLTLAAKRLGLASQASCAAAADPTAARVLDRDGCAAMLRATYVDGTSSYVVTVGAAVLPGASQAAAAAQAITGVSGADGLGPAVHTVPFKATPAAAFTDKRRQLSGVVHGGTYVVLYTVGYADTRPREPVSGDSYADGEMTSAGAGVAQAVLSVLAAPVPPPSCPGTTPGC
jgi:hypothetical protein